MSIQIQATYAKKLGLPNYSSHSFMVSVSAEVSSLRRLETEAKRVYALLQSSVDEQLKAVGFVPDTTKYGMLVDGEAGHNGASQNGHHSAAAPVSTIDTSEASDKQKGLIEKIAKREKFTPEDLDGIAKRLFGSSLAELDRKQTSSFITELLMIAGPPRFRKPSGRPAAEANGATA
jgi:hypothetical protein